MNRWLGLGLLVTLALSGCVSTHSLSRFATAPERVELSATPFFPQSDYQCGPAALATVLHTQQQPVHPEMLVPMVYLPQRRGSLQAELLAATRRFDRLAYPLSGDLFEVLAQVSAGHPVLVLQNLGLAWHPQWHFAVVVGFNRDRDELILRSGTERRLTLGTRQFVRTWKRAQNWAIVVLEPGELPAQADADRYLSAAAALEAVGRLEPARRAYASARTQWPRSVWPIMGLANVASLRGELSEARHFYDELLQIDPDNAIARYNLADAQIRSGCVADASAQLRAALNAAQEPELRARIAARMAQLPSPPSADSNAAACKSDSLP